MTSFRPLFSDYRAMIESWVAAEPTHTKNTFDWYEEPGTKSLLFTDDNGAVLVAKFTPCLRIDIDFNPEASPKRLVKVMDEGLAQMEQQAKAQGFKEFVFDSLSEKLIKFCEQLGFTKSPDYRKQL